MRLQSSLLLSVAAASVVAAETQFYFYGFGRAGVESSTDALADEGGWIQLPFEFSDNSLIANITIGTPPQEVGLIIDTGSSEFWVQTAANPFCEDPDSDDPCVYGTYNSSASSTVSRLEEAFYLSYLDNTYAKGVYAVETFGVGGATLLNQTFAIASKGNISSGLMGVGFESVESAATKYNGVLHSLKDQGYISSMVYSLYTNDLGSAGNLLFGGIDRAKYDGDLVSLPIAPNDEGQYQDLRVYLQSFGIENPDKKTKTFNSSINTAFVLDSGTTGMNLPTDLFMDLVDYLGAELNSTYDAYIFSNCQDYVSFDDGSSNYTVIFGFDGITIKVPLAYVVQSLSDDDHDTCAISVAPSNDPYSYILGDFFLNAAYAVYDFENYVIALAQANYEVEREDIVAVRSGNNSIADAVAS
ncbi:aspartic peptidase domain-containing protein [Myxozyma melibiosi]|uniref:Aspartic peptidase domain-containing protein n=1 Tax=Myxozyma melibiosi TaxID=54550 RepID=A0ABR1F9P9_9ASCO